MIVVATHGIPPCHSPTICREVHDPVLHLISSRDLRSQQQLLSGTKLDTHVLKHHIYRSLFDDASMLSLTFR